MNKLTTYGENRKLLSANSAATTPPSLELFHKVPESIPMEERTNFRRSKNRKQAVSLCLLPINMEKRMHILRDNLTG